MKRENDEELNTYCGRLRRQAGLCNFDDQSIDKIPNQLIRDQFLRSLNNIINLNAINFA